MHHSITDSDCQEHDAGMEPIPNEAGWFRCSADGCLWTRRR